MKMSVKLLLRADAAQLTPVAEHVRAKVSLIGPCERAMRDGDFTETFRLF